MSVENGTLEQHYSFYGKRVEMSRDILGLEILAYLGFNFESMVSNIKFPNEFWNSLRLVIQNLSASSLKVVNNAEEALTSKVLLGNFGEVTAEQTIEPHRDLSKKVEETQGALNLNLPEAQLAMAAMIEQVKQFIVKFHHNQLDEISSEESDRKVDSYLSEGAGKAENPTVHKSIVNSQKKLYVKIRKNKAEILRIDDSLGKWLNFISVIESTIFGATTQVKSKLSTA
jgi:hypothetical protein